MEANQRHRSITTRLKKEQLKENIEKNRERTGKAIRRRQKTPPPSSQKNQ
jgi:hypothetical protein